MADRPILFSGPMIRALLKGRKTQTRRVLTKLRRFGTVREFGPSDTVGYDWHFRDKDARWHDLRHPELLARLPYAVGDRLWVREKWSADSRYAGLPVRDVGGPIWYWADGEPPCDVTLPFPSIFMPRWASRLTLEVTDVRIQRLQEIDKADAVAEGLIELKSGRFVVNQGDQYFGVCSHNPREVYSWYWDHLNAQRGFGWDVNPWVVAVSFSVERRNIDNA